MNHGFGAVFSLTPTIATCSGLGFGHRGWVVVFFCVVLGFVRGSGCRSGRYGGVVTAAVDGGTAHSAICPVESCGAGGGQIHDEWPAVCGVVLVGAEFGLGPGDAGNDRGSDCNANRDRASVSERRIGAPQRKAVIARKPNVSARINQDNIAIMLHMMAT
jgi:hypothetical protein